MERNNSQIFEDISKNKYFLRDQKILGLNLASKPKDDKSQSTATTREKNSKDEASDPYATLYGLKKNYNP